MGNCGSNPKTNEGPELVPEPVTRDVKVEQKETEANFETENKSLGTLLSENVEQPQKTEEIKAQEEKPKPEEPKTEEVKVQEEKPKAEEGQTSKI